MPPTARLDVGLIYGSGTGTRVVEVEDKMRLDPGIVYMACPGYHILVERDRTVALSVDDPVMYSRPSIDVFFMSVAHSLKSRAIGILLTGANGDGAEGLQLIHEAGGITIVQDPEEAESPFMPRAALNRFEPSFVLELGSIANLLNSFVSSQTELSL
jgi:two-component system chemotaxis response regulator CheB